MRELTKLKRALVIERILRHIQYDHCNPFPSPMTPAAAQRLRQVLDCKDLYVLTDASASRILLLEHVHRDIGEAQPESHSYLGVFTSSDCLERFINASNLGHAANVRVLDGRAVFATLKEVRTRHTRPQLHLVATRLPAHLPSDVRSCRLHPPTTRHAVPCEQTTEADGILFNPTNTAELTDPSRSVQFGTTSPIAFTDRHPGTFVWGEFGYDPTVPFLCLIQRRHVFSADAQVHAPGDDGTGAAESPAHDQAPAS